MVSTYEYSGIIPLDAVSEVIEEQLVENLDIPVDVGLRDNYETINDDSYNTNWYYFGDCISTVDGNYPDEDDEEYWDYYGPDGADEDAPYWDATEMAQSLEKAKVYLGKKNLIDAPKEALAKNVVCGVIEDRNIGFVYNIDNDIHYFFDIDSSLVEKIVHLSNGRWQVQSKKGRNMGTYNTKAEAEKRLQQVHYFKHMNEDIKVNGDEFTFTLEDICKEYPDLISNTYESCGPAYIMPDGRFILSKDRFDTHEDLAWMCLMNLMGLTENEIENDYDTSYLTNLFTRFFKLVRVNDGSDSSVEDRAYFVVPYSSIPQSQMNALQSFVDFILANKYRQKIYDLQAFVGTSSAHQKWDLQFNNPTSDEIIEDVKFAMSRGFFGEELDEAKDSYDYTEVANHIVSNLNELVDDVDSIAYCDVDIIDDWKVGCDIEATFYDEQDIQIAWLVVRVYGEDERHGICFRQIEVSNDYQKKGIAEKIVVACLDALDEDAIVLVHMDFSGGFWYHMSQKYPNYK